MSKAEGPRVDWLRVFLIGIGTDAAASAAERGSKPRPAFQNFQYIFYAM